MHACARVRARARGSSLSMAQVVAFTAAAGAGVYLCSRPPRFADAPPHREILAGLATIQSAGDKRDALVAKQAQHEAMLGEVRLAYRGNVVRGIVHPPFVTEDSVTKLQSEFVTRDSDVFVATYPKCGTTWMQNIVLLLKYSEDPRYDTSTPVDTGKEAPWVEPTFGRPSGRRKLEELSSPRVMKTHAPVQLMPCVGNPLPPQAKVIYVGRNPKDACVSMFHHARAIPVFEYEGPFGHFVNLYISGEVEHGSFWEHHKAWWNTAQQHPHQVLFITYEEMNADPVAATGRVAAFLGWERSAACIRKVAHDSNFENMKAASESREKQGGGPGWRKVGEESHFRKGGVGGWRDYFTVAQSDLFDTKWQQTMADCTWEPDYGVS